MSNVKHCSQCGIPLQPDSKFCAQCGANTQKDTFSTIETRSDKSAITTFLLCLFLGAFGAHRFYVGKIKTGILMFLTAGGLGLWTLIDLIQIACCNFTDSERKHLVFNRGRASPLKLTLIIVGSVIATLFIYIVLLITLLLCFTNPMISPIKDQLSALRIGDMNKAYSYMANETKATLSIKVFKGYMVKHSVMTNYKSYSIPERQRKNDKGYANVILKTDDGMKTAVEYALIKENDSWKIYALKVGESFKADTQKDDNSTELFANKKDHYTIQYPSSWNYKQTEKSVIFRGKDNTPSYSSSVIIQVIPAKLANRAYKNIDAAINSLKNQISKNATNATFLSSGEAELPTDPKKVHGGYLIATYTYNGHAMKQMQFLLSRDGNKTLYSWTFTSSVEQYEKDLPIAKGIYESWKIE